MSNIIYKLHYITQEVPGKTHWQLAEEACKAGVNWIQLRVKNTTETEYLSIARKTQAVCLSYGVTLIINDNVAIAHAIRAHGVHLGKNDMEVDAARKILGDDAIIGGTANTMEDIQKAYLKGASYIGLGPYRFTTTKEKLSPILGLEGYQRIMKQMKEEQINIPVVAIGGLQPADVTGLVGAGLHGVAIGSAIGLSADMPAAVAAFKQQLKEYDHELTDRR